MKEEPSGALFCCAQDERREEGAQNLCSLIHKVREGEGNISEKPVPAEAGGASRDDAHKELATAGSCLTVGAKTLSA